MQGDSATQLKLVLNQLSEPVLFWLDGHYSGGQTAKGVKECPILEELEAIASFKCNAGSVVLIDDARLFNGSHDYPEVETIQKWVNEYLPSHQMHQDFDAICIVPTS